MSDPSPYTGFVNRYTPQLAFRQGTTAILWDVANARNPIETALGGGPVQFVPRNGLFTVRVIFSDATTGAPFDFIQFDVVGGFSNLPRDPRNPFAFITGTDLGRRMIYPVVFPAVGGDITAGALTFVGATTLPNLATQLDFTYIITGNMATSTFRFVFPITPSNTSVPTIELAAGANLPANTDVDVFVTTG